MASSSNGISTSISSSPLSFLRTLWTSTIVPIFRDPGSLRLLVTVLSTSLLTGAGLLSFQTLQRQTQRKELRDSIEARFADADGDDDARRNRRRSLLRRRRRASSSSNSVKRPNGIHIHGDGFEDDASDDSNGDGDEDEDEEEELEDYTMTPTTARREMQRARSALADMAAEEEQQTSIGRQPRTPGYGNSNSAQKKVIDQEIIDEALARNLAFLGPEALAKVRDSFVIVVGLGGVGSAAANMLVRSGVGKIRLIDFDQVSLSSLNRHSVAELSDVGTSKVKCCASRFSAIAPWVDVEPVNQLFSLADADELLAGRPDWVVDCIDNIGTKVELLAYCRKHDIKVFSAMGAGGKYDTTRVQISDISATHEDPLARSVRIRLKKEGITHGVPVVYSTEVPHAAGKLLPLPEDEFQKGNVGELHALEAFRVRILPVLGPLPCMFGQAAAGYIVASLAGNLQLNPLAIKNRHKVYTRMYQDLLAREQRRTGDVRIPISEADVCYLFEDLHRGRSVTCPLNAICAKPTLIRWDAGGAVSVDNLVVMDRGEADRHDREVLHGDKTAAELWGEETVALVEKRRMLERENRDYRLL